MKLLIINTD